VQRRPFGASVWLRRAQLGSFLLLCLLGQTRAQERASNGDWTTRIMSRQLNISPHYRSIGARVWRPVCSQKRVVPSRCGAAKVGWLPPRSRAHNRRTNNDEFPMFRAHLFVHFSAAPLWPQVFTWPTRQFGPTGATRFRLCFGATRSVCVWSWLRRRAASLEQCDGWAAARVITPRHWPACLFLHSKCNAINYHATTRPLLRAHCGPKQSQEQAEGAPQAASSRRAATTKAADYDRF